MTRPWIIWTVFTVFIVLLLAPMGWLSVKALSLEEAQAELRQRDLLEEAVRLGLWRLDSALGDLVAEETRRPHQFYSAFFAAEEAFDPDTNGAIPGGILMPSPLLGELPQHVRVHFQSENGGRFSSPQVPTGELRQLARERYTTDEEIAEASRRLGALASTLGAQRLADLLPRVSVDKMEQGKVADAQQRLQTSAQVEGQAARSQREWQARFQNIDRRQQIVGRNALMMPTHKIVVHEGASRALWVEKCLIVARRVSLGKQNLVQGAWLDWQSLKPWLLKEIADILPGAQLEPVRDPKPDMPTRMLTSLPLRLVPGVLPGEQDTEASPTRFSLLLAWGCVILAAVAVAILLTGTVALSERRRDFVSAVTHELRTPLTTFRMYTEMLVEGMVPEPSKQAEYLRKLKGESDRLAHLVENVLTYARLEARSRVGLLERITAGDLLDRALPRLRDRAEQAGLEFTASLDDGLADKQVSADPAAVDQILFNLVDNAAKYAATSEDRRLHLEATEALGSLCLRVRDHGPGIPAAERKRLFRPFVKSRSSTTPSAPGVGLGLALSRRLARSLGGDLAIDDAEGGGASITLSLPL